MNYPAVSSGVTRELFPFAASSGELTPKRLENTKCPTNLNKNVDLFRHEQRQVY